MDFDKLYIKFNNYNDRDSMTVDEFINMIATKVMETITQPETSKKKGKPKKE